MEKPIYHIDINGKPARCRAKSRACPKGPHFNSSEEAQSYLDETLSNSAQKSTTISTNDYNLVYKNKNSFANRIYNVSQSTRSGWKAEIFMSESYARKDGLKYALVLNKKGTYNLITPNGNKLPEGMTKQDMASIIKKANQATKEAYGDKIYVGKKELLEHKKKLEDNPVKIIYFDDSKDKLFIQNGGPETLDALKVTEDSLRILELKKTTQSGSQMKSRTVSLGRTGDFDVYDDYLTDEVMEQVNNLNIYDYDKDRVDLKLTNTQALRQFVRDYKSEGADEFVFMNALNRPVAVDLTGNEEEIVRELENQNLVATIKVRTNLRHRPMDKSSKERLLENKNNLYTGNFDENGNIRLDQINKSYMKETSGFMRFGEFKTKLKMEDIRALPKDTLINIKDLRYFSPVLGGDIKLRSSARPTSF